MVTKRQQMAELRTEKIGCSLKMGKEGKDSLWHGMAVCLTKGKWIFCMS